MKPETKLWHDLKNITPTISWTRLENTSVLGTPDLLGYNTSGKFFTVELKLTSANKINLSAHQISFHLRHPNKTFILQKTLGPLSIKLFAGKDVLRLKNREPCAPVAESWTKIQEYLVNVT